MKRVIFGSLYAPRPVVSSFGGRSKLPKFSKAPVCVSAHQLVCAFDFIHFILKIPS